VGLTTRRFVETSAYTILSIPEGMDPADVARHFRDESYRLTTVGPVVGLDLSVAVMDHLSVTPEVLFGYGRWDFFKYVELGLGVRAAWRF
jgi:hypothetical protein